MHRFRSRRLASQPARQRTVQHAACLLVGHVFDAGGVRAGDEAGEDWVAGEGVEVDEGEAAEVWGCGAVAVDGEAGELGCEAGEGV